jgi:hypothetical protein
VYGHVIYDGEVKLIDTWRALESLVDQGRCKSTGLSVITLDALNEIVAAARIKPAVVQIELPEWELLEFCKEHGILLLAFAPLGHGMQPNVLEDAVITGIAKRVPVADHRRVRHQRASPRQRQRVAGGQHHRRPHRRDLRQLEPGAADRRALPVQSEPAGVRQRQPFGGLTGVPGILRFRPHRALCAAAGGAESQHRGGRHPGLRRDLRRQPGAVSLEGEGRVAQRPTDRRHP